MSDAISDVMGKLVNKVILAELGTALDRLDKAARIVATFPRELLDRRPDNEKEIDMMVAIFDKAKDVADFLAEAKKIVTVQVAPKASSATPTADGVKSEDDACSCVICTVRRNLTQKPARQASAVPTSSLDILIEMILGKAPTPPTAAPTEAPTAEKGA